MIQLSYIVDIELHAPRAIIDRLKNILPENDQI